MKATRDYGIFLWIFEIHALMTTYRPTPRRAFPLPYKGGPFHRSLSCCYHMRKGCRDAAWRYFLALCRSRSENTHFCQPTRTSKASFPRFIYYLRDTTEFSLHRYTRYAIYFSLVNYIRDDIAINFIFKGFEIFRIVFLEYMEFINDKTLIHL